MTEIFNIDRNMIANCINDFYFRTRGQIPLFIRKKKCLGKKTNVATPTQSSGTMELGIKENIDRIMKDCLVSLFLSVVGRAPFDGVKERWTF